MYVWSCWTLVLGVTGGHYYAAYGIPKAQLEGDPVEYFAENTWLLAAAGTSGVLPPSHSCVRITVTETNDTADCVYVSLDNTVINHKVYRIDGINEQNWTKIRTIGPVLPHYVYETRKHLYMSESYYSTACWDPKTFKLRQYKYIVHYPSPVTQPNTKYLVLMGVRTRTPHPEIQIALLSRAKYPKNDVMRMVNSLNRYAFRYFYEYDETIPQLELKCAIDYDERDRKDPLNQLKHIQIAPQPTSDGPLGPYKSSFECP